MKRFMNKKVAAIGLAAGLVLGIAGAATAYFTTSGTGNGSTTAGAAGGVSLTATIAGNIVPGDGGQTVSFSADNTNATSADISTVSFVSVTAPNATAACQAVISGDPGQFSMTQVTENQVVPGNATTSLAVTGTLVWADSNSLNQTPCAGQPLQLNVSTP
jgi:hypothetical protein